VSKKRKAKYSEWQREQNKENLTWRQFYERLYGKCLWMESTQYGGSWLDKAMGE
jgi:hypothetical protein